MVGAHPGNWMRTFFEENQIEAIKSSEEIKLVGCLIFNLLYDSHKGDSMPSEGKILFPPWILSEKFPARESRRNRILSESIR